MIQLYSGLLATGAPEVVAMPSQTALTPMLDFLTRRFRRLRAGANLPITNGVWYETPHLVSSQRRAGNEPIGASEVNLDMGALLRALPSFKKKLVSWGCDAIVSYATIMTTPALFAYSARSFRRLLYFLDMPVAKTLITEGTPAQSPIVEFVRKFERWILEHTDVLACSSHLVERDWHETYGVRPTFLPPGCFPHPRPPGDKSNVILTVTHWYPDKRPFYFLELARRLRRSSLVLAMAGHWPVPELLAEMKDRVFREGLEKRLLLFPNCSEERLATLYEQARCFIAPPKGGGYIMGALEAAAYGTPIIYPRASGAWDVFEENTHGFAPDMADIEEVASCIRNFEGDTLVKKMGLSIWSKAKELSWENHVAALEGLMT